ncbi:MAG TPA: DMT family transporter [Thiotrichaceae bacterium]|jgi:drug/metabolite transporter (DMT)-like permease|nr:DMT family transporter [Thiotrichaceae bacterium]HIM08681.1 DMT family transporter [Gammaproteobacteria bacterium]
MKTWTPTIALIVCHALTGTASVLMRYFVNILEPVEIAFLRYLLGGLFILPLFFIFRNPNLTRSLCVKTAVLGILFFGIFPFLFAQAFVYTNAARGSLVLATMPIWTMLIAKAIGHDKVNLLSIFAISITLLGLFIALSDKLFMSVNEAASFKGELIMLLTAIIGAIYAIHARPVLKQIPASTMTPIAMLAGCAVLFPFSIASGIDDHVLSLTNMQLGLVFYVGLITGGMAFFLFNWVLTRTTATFNTMFVTLNPIVAIFLGYLFLGEVIQINFIIGVFIVFSGLGIAVYSQQKSS